MIKNTLIAALALAGAVSMQSCKDKKHTTESGLQYVIYNDNDSDTSHIKVGDVAFIYYTVSAKHNGKDTTLEDSRKQNPEPLPFMVQEDKAGYPLRQLMEGFTKLSTGDSASLFLSVDTIYGKNPTFPPFIDKGSLLTFTVKVQKVQTSKEVEKDMEEKAQKQKDIDEQLIKEYIQVNKLNATRTESGLYYVKVKEGKGAKPNKGETIKVHYTGKLLTGMEFDSSVKRGPFEVPVGAGQVIPGWDEGLLLLSQGEKAILIIPSHLGYGAQGGGPIPPNAVLVFDVEYLGKK